MKKFQVLLFFILIASYVSAQSQFMLYSLKGNVSVVENNITSKAKVGKMLDSKATIKIATGGSVTLICNEAAMFSIMKAGNYPLSKFNDSCQAGRSSVSANYVKYVWAQMTKASVDAGSNRKAFMNTVGAVTRNVNNIWIDSKLDTVNYAGGDFPLSWKCYSDSKEFEVQLYTQDNIATPFFSTYVTKLKINIPDLVSKMKPGSAYFWNAAVKGEQNDDLKVLNYVTKEKFDEVMSIINSQKPGVEAPAEEAYRTAFMLEDAHYLADAYKYYAKAAQLEPTNALYRSTLMSFKKDYEIK